MEGDKNKVSALLDSFRNLTPDEILEFHKGMNEAIIQKATTAPMSADDSKKLAKKLVNNLIG